MALLSREELNDSIHAKSTQFVGLMRDADHNGNQPEPDPNVVRLNELARGSGGVETREMRMAQAALTAGLTPDDLVLLQGDTPDELATSAQRIRQHIDSLPATPPSAGSADQGATGSAPRGMSDYQTAVLEAERSGDWRGAMHMKNQQAYNLFASSHGEVGV